MPNGDKDPRIDAARRFLAHWLTNRRTQLADNAGGTSEGAAAAQSQLRNLFSVPAYTSVPSMNAGYNRDYIQRMLKEANSGNGAASKVAGFRARFYKGVLDEANRVMADPKIGGVYANDGAGHRVVVANGSNRGIDSDITHELAHSMEAKPQEKRISEIIDKAKIKHGKNGYWDSPTEVHSRLMEVRRGLNLDPNKVYNSDDIKSMREKSEGKYWILDRYDDETVLRLLNEVAAVSRPAEKSKGLNS